MYESIIKNLEEAIGQIEDLMIKAHKQKDKTKVQYLRQQISTTESIIYALKNNRIARNDADLKRLDRE